MSLVERHLNFNNTNLQGFLSTLDNSIQIDNLLYDLRKLPSIAKYMDNICILDEIQYFDKLN